MASIDEVRKRVLARKLQESIQAQAATDPQSPPSADSGPAPTPAPAKPESVSSPAAPPEDLDAMKDTAYADNPMYMLLREKGLTPENSIKQIEQSKRTSTASEDISEPADLSKLAQAEALVPTTSPVEILAQIGASAPIFGMKATAPLWKQPIAWAAEYGRAAFKPGLEILRNRAIGALTGTATNTAIMAGVDEVSEKHPIAGFATGIGLSVLSAATIERAINKTLMGAVRVADVEGAKAGDWLKSAFKTIHDNIKREDFTDPKTREVVGVAIREVEEALASGKTKLSDQHIAALNSLKAKVSEGVKASAPTLQALPSTSGQQTLVGQGTPTSTGSIKVSDAKPVMDYDGYLKLFTEGKSAEALDHVDNNIRDLYRKSRAATIGAKPIEGAAPKTNLKTGEKFAPKLTDEDYLKGAELFGVTPDRSLPIEEQLDTAAKALTAKLGKGYTQDLRTALHLMDTMEAEVRRLDGTQYGNFARRAYERAKFLLIKSGKDRIQKQQDNVKVGSEVITKLAKAASEVEGVTDIHPNILASRATANTNDPVKQVEEFVADVLGKPINYLKALQAKSSEHTLEMQEKTKALIPKLAAKLRAADGEYTEQAVNKWMAVHAGVEVPASKPKEVKTQKGKKPEADDLPYEDVELDIPETFRHKVISQDATTRPVVRTETESKTLEGGPKVVDGELTGTVGSGQKVDLVERTDVRDAPGTVGPVSVYATKEGRIPTVDEFIDDWGLPKQKREFVKEPRRLPTNMPKKFDPALVKTKEDAVKVFQDLLAKNKASLSKYFNHYVNWNKKGKTKVPELTHFSLLRAAELMGYIDNPGTAWSKRQKEAIAVIKERLSGPGGPGTDVPFLVRDEQDAVVALLRTMDELVYEAKRLEVTPFKQQANEIVLAARGEIEGQDYIGAQHYIDYAREHLGQFLQEDSNREMKFEGEGDHLGIVGRPKLVEADTAPEPVQEGELSTEEVDTAFGEEGVGSDNRDPMAKLTDMVDEGVGGFQDAQASDAASSIKDVDLVTLKKLGQEFEDMHSRLMGDIKKPAVYSVSKPALDGQVVEEKIINHMKVNSTDDLASVLDMWALRVNSPYRSNTNRNLVTERVGIVPSTTLLANQVNQLSDAFESSLNTAVGIANRVMENGTILDALALKKQLIISDLIRGTLEGNVNPNYAQYLAEVSWADTSNDIKLWQSIHEVVMREYGALFTEFGGNAVELDRSVAHILSSLGEDVKTLSNVTKGFLEIYKNPEFKRAVKELTDVSESTYTNIAEQLRKAGC